MPPGVDYSQYMYEADDQNERRESEISSSQRLLAKKVTLDDFELLQKVGSGSFGRVMLAKKKADNSLFAIKFISKAKLLRLGDSAVQHVIDENRILKKMDHPFVLTLHYSFQDEDRVYLVTNWVGGGDMLQHLELVGIFSEEWTVFYGGQLVSAIAYVHEHGVVYRDLKPENVLLGLDGYLVLCDFGLAKKVAIASCGGGDFIISAPAETFCGTPLYLAPEVVARQPYGRSVDWWTFGCILCELLTGHPPFVATDMVMLMEMIKSGTVKLEKEELLKPSTVSFVHALLQREPTDRLGCGPAGPAAIREHAFFAELDFQKLEAKELQAPFVPTDDLLSKTLTSTNFPIGAGSSGGGAKMGSSLTPQNKSARAFDEAFESFTKAPSIYSNSSSAGGYSSTTNMSQHQQQQHHQQPHHYQSSRSTSRAGSNLVSVVSTSDSSGSVLQRGEASSSSVGLRDFFPGDGDEAFSATSQFTASGTSSTHFRDRGHSNMSGNSSDFRDREHSNISGISSDFRDRGHSNISGNSSDFRDRGHSGTSGHSSISGHNHAHLEKRGSSRDGLPTSQKLCDAARRGNVESLRKYLDRGGDVDTADLDSRTPLHLAATQGHYDCAKFLLDRGGSLNLRDRWGNVALDDAIREEHHALARLLVDAGGRNTKEDDLLQSKQKTHRTSRLNIFAPPLSTINSPVQSYSAAMSPTTAAYAAATGNSFFITEAQPPQSQELMAHVKKSMRSRISGKFKIQPAHAPTPAASSPEGKAEEKEEHEEKKMEEDDVLLSLSEAVCSAASKGDVVSLESLIGGKGADVNATDGDRRTPLHLASAQGHFSTVAFLLAHGANVEARDRWGNAPIDEAIRQQQTEVRLLLVDAGGSSGDRVVPPAALTQVEREEEEKRERAEARRPPAINSERPPITPPGCSSSSFSSSSSLKRGGVSPMGGPAMGAAVAAAAAAASMGTPQPLAQTLQEEALSRTGYRPASSALLCNAATKGDLATLQCALASGADVDSANYDKRTALHLAASEGHLEAVEYLLDQGADLHLRDRFGHTPIDDALHFGRSGEVIDKLVASGSRTDIENTPSRVKADLRMCDAARANDVTRMTREVNAGADPNAAGHDRRTALHLAATEGHLEAVTFLLKVGADPALKDRWGHTARDDARRERHRDVASALHSQALGSWTSSTNTFSSASLGGGRSKISSFSMIKSFSGRSLGASSRNSHDSPEKQSSPPFTPTTRKKPHSARPLFGGSDNNTGNGASPQSFSSSNSSRSNLSNTSAKSLGGRSSSTRRKPSTTCAMS